MKPIIPPVEKDLLISELTKDKFLRKSNFGNTELYVFSHKNAPNLLRELGRLRELTFRAAGGGTGKDIDLDRFDQADDPYFQLIVWDPEEKEILGGYRFVLGENVVDDYKNKLATSNLFEFSDKFISDILPYTIELGRSFVQPAYQKGNLKRKGMFALDNLWDGLGALTVEFPEMKYYFGKVTMYKQFDVEARNYLLSFLKIYFSDTKNLIKANNPILIDYKKYVQVYEKDNYKKDYKTLMNLLKEKGERIPPLINAYMNLSPSMVCFDTVQNDFFGGVEETAILVAIDDIYNAKKERHVSTYKNLFTLSNMIKRRFNINITPKHSK